MSERKEKTARGKEVNLGEGSVGRLLFRLALPAITAQIINLLYNLVDRIYIGHLPGIGAEALTGVGVTLPVILAISAFAYLFSTGGAARASIMMGRQKKEEAERIMGNCAAALIAAAVVLTVFFLVFGRQILLLFGASERTIGYAWDYMKIYSLGTIFVQIALGLNYFINAQGYATMGMLTVIIGAGTNIILDPILMFGFDMGVQGAALATIISQGLSAAWILIFLSSRRSFLKLKLCNLRISPAILAPCIALGASPFVMQFTESILNICFNVSLRAYGGDIAVGVMAVLSSVMQFALLPITGMTQGSQPIVSYNYGAGKLDRVRSAFFQSAQMQRHLCGDPVGAGHAVSADFHAYVHHGSKIHRHGNLGHAGLYGRNLCDGRAVCLSADLCGPGQRQNVAVSGASAKGNSADSADLHPAPHSHRP